MISGKWKVYKDPPLTWLGRSPTPPSDPVDGAMYSNTEDDYLYVWRSHRLTALEMLTAELMEDVDWLPKGKWLRVEAAS